MYIYKTTDLTNGFIYIGQCARSIESTKNYIGSGKKLKHAIDKHSKSNFTKEVIQECSSSDELNEAEVYWIEFYNSMNPDIGYNILPGGAIGEAGAYISKALSTPEAFIKSSKRNLKLWEDDSYRKKVTNSNIETWGNIGKKEEHGKLMKKKWESETARKNLSVALKNMERVECPHCGKIGALNIMNGRHFDNCIKHKDPIKRKIAIERWENIKLNTKKITCPHCGKIGDVGNMNRWHFDNCKLKTI